jgi:hypothetical protein
LYCIYGYYYYYWRVFKLCTVYLYTELEIRNTKFGFGCSFNFSLRFFMNSHATLKKKIIGMENSHIHVTIHYNNAIILLLFQ